MNKRWPIEVVLTTILWFKNQMITPYVESCFKRNSQPNCGSCFSSGKMMPIAQPKNELKKWRNPFESIWNKKTATKKLLFSCNPFKTQNPRMSWRGIGRRQTCDSNSNWSPTNKRRKPGDSPKHFWLCVFVVWGLLVFYSLTYKKCLNFCIS